MAPATWIFLNTPFNLSPIKKTPFFINQTEPSEYGVVRFQKRSYSLSFNIYVGNLSFDTNEGDLSNLFAQYGAVDSVKIISDQFTGKSRGFGFVEMQNREEGLLAVKELDSREVGGRALKVNEAKPKNSGGPRRDDRRGGGSRW